MDFDENLDQDELNQPEADFIFGDEGDKDIMLANKKDSVLFVIDCNQTMLDPNPYNEGGISNL